MAKYVNVNTLPDLLHKDNAKIKLKELGSILPKCFKIKKCLELKKAPGKKQDSGKYCLKQILPLCL